MTAESTVKPNIFWIRKVKGNTLYLRLRWDIHQEKRTDMDEEPYQMWVYEEQEFLREVPSALNVHVEKGLEQYWDLNEGIAMRRLSLDVQTRIHEYLAKHEVELLNMAKKIAKTDRAVSKFMKVVDVFGRLLAWIGIGNRKRWKLSHK